MDELLQGVDPLLYLAPLQNPQVDSARGCEGRRRCQFDVSRGAGITEDERRRPNRTPDLHFKRRKIARTPPWSRTHAKTPLPFTPDIRRAHTWERSGRSGRGTPSPACRCSALLGKGAHPLSVRCSRRWHPPNHCYRWTTSASASWSTSSLTPWRFKLSTNAVTGSCSSRSRSARSPCPT
jgi:hypothetical protein